jgi:hypothetical protein
MEFVLESCNFDFLNFYSVKICDREKIKVLPSHLNEKAIKKIEK